MKRIMSALLFLFVAGLFLARSQNVAYYGFTDSIGMYVPVEGTTEVTGIPASGTDISQWCFGSSEPLHYDGNPGRTNQYLPVGFDFVYSGQVFDKFVAFGKGFIVLGHKDSTGVYLSGGLLSLMQNNSIGLSASQATYTTDKTEISYKTEGQPGHRILTVVYSSLGYGYTGGKCPDSTTFYLQLSEADSSIRMVFGDMVSSSYGARFSIGLRKNDNENHFRVPTANDWSDSKQSTTSARLVGTVFPKGTNYIFSYPEPCSRPDINGISHRFNETFSDGFAAAVDLSGTEADGLMISLAETGTLWEEFPKDGIEYGVGVLPNASGVNILFSGDLQQASVDYSANGLKPNTEYIVNVYAYNRRCVGGPVYSESSTDSVYTATLAPAFLGIVGLGDDSIVLEAEENILGEEMLILQTTVLKTDDRGLRREMAGHFGSPEGEYNVGDTVYTKDNRYGGVVIYKGGTNRAIKTEMLKSNTIYHFGAFSKGKDGRYSSLSVHADTITSAVLPFEADFGSMPCETNPYAWYVSSPDSWRVLYPDANNKGSILGTIPGSTGIIRTEILATPDIRFSEGKGVRMIFEYNMYGQKSLQEKSLYRSDWGVSDSLVFEVAAQGEDYVPFYAISRANADDFASSSVFSTKNLSLYGYGGKEVKIRIRYVSDFSFYTFLTIKRISIFSLPECDYPALVSVPDTSVVADRALVEWVPGASGESVWDVSYVKVDESGNPLSLGKVKESGTNKAQLDGLETLSLYRARVRAVCGVGSVSDWIYSESFRSGQLLPLQETFDSLPKVGSGLSAYTALPFGWEEKVTGLETLTDLSLIAPTRGGTRVEFKEWKTENNVVPGRNNGSLRYRFSNAMPAWVVLPTLDFSAEASAKKLVFSASVINSSGETAAKPLMPGSKVFVVASYNGGYTYSASDTLRVMDESELAAVGDSTGIEVDLNRLAGPVRLALHFAPAIERAKEPHSIYLDNFRIEEQCSPVRNLEVVELSAVSALLRWNAIPQVDTWIVKVQSADSNISFETRQTEILVENLDPRTSYTVSVSYLCAAEDTAAWRTISFTTGGTDCEEVTDLTVQQITQKTALLTWTGTSSGYRIRIRPYRQQSGYSEYFSNASTYAVTNLLPDMEYECSVQSVCSQSAADTAAFCPSVRFRTEPVSCLPPAALSITEVSYRSVGLRWEGEAQQYQIAFKQEAALSYTPGITTQDKSALQSGLESETTYLFRVRGICADGDTSVWSDPIEASTTPAPVCPAPTGLRVETITANSAVLLWDAEDDASSCLLRYRSASAASWDSVRNLTDSRYVLENLLPNNLYVWTVKNLCPEGFGSHWAVQAEFSTTDAGTETNNDYGWRIYATPGQIHLLNPSHVFIDRIEMLERTGGLLESFPIQSDGDVSLRTKERNCLVILRVRVREQFVVYKLFLP